MSVNIFLSHASEDHNQVADLYNRLEEEGLDPWMDKRDILGGEDWERFSAQTSSCSVLPKTKTAANGGRRTPGSYEIR